MLSLYTVKKIAKLPPGSLNAPAVRLSSISAINLALVLPNFIECRRGLILSNIGTYPKLSLSLQLGHSKVLCVLYNSQPFAINTHLVI